MVSPLEKGGNAVEQVGARASVSGEGIAYLSTGAFDEPKGMDLLGRYLSRRGSDGWSTSNITPPSITYQAFIAEPFEELLFTSELSRGVLLSQDAPLVGGELPGYYRLYLWNEGQASYQTVSNITPPQSEAEQYRGAGFASPMSMGASSDLSHVVFEQRASLVEGASPGRVHIYEWAGGRLSLVDVAPEGVTFEAEDDVGAPATSYFSRRGDRWHAVSADGSRVFFTAGEPSGGNGNGAESKAGQLYVRENPMAPQSPGEHGVCTVAVDACTVEVSASQRAVPDPHGPQPAFFRGASADGSLVFFVSYAELTDDANTGPADNAPNLYAYDLGTGVLTDLTVDTSPGDVDGAAVVGFVTAAENGSYVYFVANGVLANNTSGPLAESAEPGNCPLHLGGAVNEEPACNLYVERFNGSGWEAPRFVARLAGYNGLGQSTLSDEMDWRGFAEPSEEDGGPGEHRVRVTPDGTHLAFQSVRSLTGYDNVPVSHEECENERCSVSEVYLYDALNGSLVCASCDPSGAAPVARAELGESWGEEGDAFARPSPLYEARNLSSDGNRLFFQSRDPLVAQDTNGRQDVYEWEASGEGSCAQEPGCVLPVSDVSGEDDSFFMDASPNGNDVFITTGDRLVPSDTDDLRDVYDVRVDGGFPTAPVTPPACDSADACRGPAGVAQGSGSPASAAFSGAGNLTPTPPSASAVTPKPKRKAKACRRGLVHRHDGCVRQRRSRGRVKRRGSSPRTRALRAQSGRGR
jgi:WD40-like Beta Propeller Repeat